MKQQTLPRNASEQPSDEDKKTPKKPQMAMITPNPQALKKTPTNHKQKNLPACLKG